MLFQPSLQQANLYPRLGARWGVLEESFSCAFMLQKNVTWEFFQ